MREIGVTGESWREVAVDEYDQNSLYKCMKFSKNKYQTLIKVKWALLKEGLFIHTRLRCNTSNTGNALSLV